MRFLFRITQLLVFLMACSTLSSVAKDLEDYTLEEVLEGISDANGGIDRIESVLNVRLIGTTEGPDAAHDFIILKRRPNLLRSRLKFEDKVIETGFDGSILWRRLEYRGHDKVEVIEDPELVLNMKLEADFDGPLVGPPVEGVSLRLAGVERIDRVDFFLLEVATEESRSIHYVDSRTFREMQVIKTISRPGLEPAAVRTKFYDIERHGGIWIARRVVKEFPDGRTQLIRVKQVEINPGILDFSFAVPKERNPVAAN